MTTFTSSSKTVEKLAYDAANRLTTLTEQTWAAAPVQEVVDVWDAASRKTSQSVDGVVTTYSYDKVDRLTGQLVTNGTATFAYNNVGDLSVKWHQGAAPMTFTHNLFGQIVTFLEGADLTTVSYDRAGNMESEFKGTDLTEYRYSQENQMTEIDHPNGEKSTYTYNGPGYRRTAQEPGAINPTTFVWDGFDYLMEEN